MKKRHSEEQIIRILREADKNEIPLREVCQQAQHHGADVVPVGKQVRRDGSRRSTPAKGARIGERQAQAASC